LDATKAGDLETIDALAIALEEGSPYDKVKAAVRNTDGGKEAIKVRVWIFGMIFVTICSGFNMFFSMRSPAISFPAVAVLLLVYLIAVSGLDWSKPETSPSSA
jgi:hypothetical protein